MLDGSGVEFFEHGINQLHELGMEHAARTTEREVGMQCLCFFDQVLDFVEDLLVVGFHVGERQMVDLGVDFERKNFAHGVRQGMVGVGQTVDRETVRKGETRERFRDFVQVLLGRNLVDALDRVAHEVAHTHHVGGGVGGLQLLRAHVRVFHELETVLFVFAIGNDQFNAAECIGNGEYGRNTALVDVLVVILGTYKSLAPARSNLRGDNLFVLFRIVF